MSYFHGGPYKGKAFAHLDSAGGEPFLFVAARNTPLLTEHGYVEVAIHNTLGSKPTISALRAEADVPEVPDEQRLELIQHVAQIVFEMAQQR